MIADNVGKGSKAVIPALAVQFAGLSALFSRGSASLIFRNPGFAQPGEVGGFKEGATRLPIADRLEAAATRAIEIGTLTYGSVRSILDNKIDRQTAQQPPTNGVDPPPQYPRTALLPLRRMQCLPIQCSTS